MLDDKSTEILGKVSETPKKQWCTPMLKKSFVSKTTKSGPRVYYGEVGGRYRPS